MKHIVLLGSTGSIGENTLRVVEALSDRFRVVGLAARSNAARVLEQAAQWGVNRVALADQVAAERAAREAPAGVTVLAGEDGLCELAGDEADLVVCAVVGMAGLRPVLAAVERGTDVALATKEVLVVAGQLVMETCARTGARLLPVDSEHSAIFQCLGGQTDTSNVRRLVLTASGGPFAARPEVDLARVTVDEALNHPRWDMGRKVTIDSATLMNKGLEIMEAHWLFGMPVDRIDVVIHPESIVHSLVEFTDGSLMAQLGLPDMRFAIQYAMTWPDRPDSGLPRLDLLEMAALHFRAPDEDRFPCLRLARMAGAAGGTLPAVLNAANEAAVEKFLAGSLPFSGIWGIVESVMAAHAVIADPTLDDLTAADRWARGEVCLEVQ